MPAGGHRDIVNGTPTGSWGSAWTVFILPYIEQGPLWSSFTFPGSSGWGATNNAAMASNVKIPVYLCPSSVIGDTASGSPPGNTGPVGANHYVGISGASNGNNTTTGGLIPGYADTRFNTPNSGTAGCCSGGIVSGGGVIGPGFKVRLGDIKDGTSNTVIVGEQNDFLETANGTQVAWSTGRQHGFMIGWHNVLGTVPPNLGNNGDLRTFQMTTIRYQINLKKGPLGTGWTDTPGNCGGQGVCDNIGTNIPLNSAHPGGVNALMGDGTVKFLRDSLPLDTLARLAIRDDKMPIGDF